MSLTHFAESVVRAYKIATTPPMEPVLVTADIDLQEDPIHDGGLRLPRLTRGRGPPGGRPRRARGSGEMAGRRGASRDHRRPHGAHARRVKLLVELAEALQAPVVDLGGRMNFPMTHPLCHNEARRGLVREADVVLLLEVGDPYGQFNSISDPHKDTRSSARRTEGSSTCSMQDVYIRSNYQDFQRYQAADLAINGDAQASLPALIDGSEARFDRRSAARLRGARREAEGGPREGAARARDEAAIGWDLQPITTARLAAETWNAIKGNDWCLATSDRIPWARRLGPRRSTITCSAAPARRAWATARRLARRGAREQVARAS
jgi:thiamine pyrophosphate-dependent acetolactate synthase large subunit-like protein